jgi:hypothetical protein
MLKQMALGVSILRGPADAGHLRMRSLGEVAQHLKDS